MDTMTPAAAIRATPRKQFVRVDDLPGTPEAARKAASRAAACGELVKIRRGLYYRGIPTRYGLTKPRAEDVVREAFRGHGAGPAGFSAARLWEVTTQVPATQHVATLRKVEGLKGVKQTVRSNIERAHLTPREIALLELLRSPENYVEAGWNTLVERYRHARAECVVRERELRSAVRCEHSPTTRENFERLVAAV
ncbi:hypothetical protein ACI2IP_02135 [Microbacterium sp. NPDC090218]